MIRTLSKFPQWFCDTIGTVDLKQFGIDATKIKCLDHSTITIENNTEYEHIYDSPWSNNPPIIIPRVLGITVYVQYCKPYEGKEVEIVRNALAAGDAIDINRLYKYSMKHTFKYANKIEMFWFKNVDYYGAVFYDSRSAAWYAGRGVKGSYK